MSSASLPLSEQLALLRTLIQGAQITRFASLSTWGLLIWDHIITFEREVEYIWRGKKRPSNIVYLLLRYASAVIITFNVFSGLNVPTSDKFCIVLMHLSSWPLLVLNSIAECVLAARVVVLWENSRIIITIVSMAWALGVAAVSFTFAKRIPIYSTAKSISLPYFNYYDCILQITPEAASHLAFWKMWLILLAYNTILGALACWKAIVAYRDKTRRRSYTGLLEILVRGSLDYYVIIIGLNIGMLVVWRYGNASLFAAGSGMTLPITVVLTCRLILHLRQAYYRPLGELPPVGSSASASWPARPVPSMSSERIPLYYTNTR